MSSVSVVIRAYNEEKHLDRLLSGIRGQRFDGSVEVLLVDSGSTDRTREIARSHGVRVLGILPEAFSFGHALNVGLKAARGTYAVLISAHCVPEGERWLEELIRPLREDPQVALVYGRQRGDARTKFSEHQIFRKWFPERSVSAQSIPFCNNANAAIRRSLWLETPYDKELTGLEDLDWAQKMIGRGYHLSYRAEAGILHLHDETWRQIFNRYRREAIAYRRIFPLERFGFPAFIRLLLLNIHSDLKQALARKLFWKRLREIVWFRATQFWGTYRGYAHREQVSRHLRELFYYPPAPARGRRGNREKNSD